MEGIRSAIALLISEYRSGMGRSVPPDTLIERLGALCANARSWEIAGRELLAHGDAVGACAVLRESSRRFPGDASLHCLYGHALRLHGDRSIAEQELRVAVRADAGLREAVWSLSFLLREQGRFQAVADVLRSHAAQVSGDADEIRRVATFLAQCNHHADALEICDGVPIANVTPQLLSLSGSLASTLGQFDRAARDLRRSLELEPRQAAAWLWFAMARPFHDREDPDLKLLDTVAQKAEQGSELHVCTRFALGKAFDDLGDIESAVRRFREANDLVANRQPWNAAEWQAFVARQLAAPLPTALDDSGVAPIFVVGMPRTGTTLIAKLLSDHPHISNRGELAWLPAFAKQAGLQASPTFLRRAAELYSAQLRQDDAPSRYYMDKNPFNFRYLGLAAALFPNARVIHCLRDPRDSALSMWRQYFADSDAGYAYRFSDIALVMQGHDALMTHWKAVLPLPFYEVRYEELVTGSAQVVSKLLHDLELDPKLAGSTSSNVIGTASMWQARQPIHSGSVGRWHAYAEYLPELVAAIPPGAGSTGFANQLHATRITP